MTLFFLFSFSFSNTAAATDVERVLNVTDDECSLCSFLLLSLLSLLTSLFLFFLVVVASFN